MNRFSTEIQKVINTLEDMQIQATYDNCNHMLGSLQTLAKIRDELEKEFNDGNFDNE